MRVLAAVVVVTGIGIAFGAEGPPPETQIAAAVQAAPAEMRAGASVLGFDAQGKRTTLRKGSNELICLSSDPAKNTFEVDCYHKDLEPFMARGRELLAQGVTGAKRNEIRFKEVQDGTLKIPREPRTLYVLTGNRFDAAAGTVENAYQRWVIYVPFATPETTGLPTKGGSDGAPWLMGAGTAGAHIMVSPPRKKQ